MPRITEIEIEGFKGLQSLTVEPTAINVITGRNNTGKTSLLEAIDLAFDPKGIVKFESNLDTLVNIECERTAISLNARDSNISVDILEPNGKRARELLIEALHGEISNIMEWARDRGVFNEEEFESINQNIHTIINDSITPEIVEDAKTEIVMLSIEGETYPYLYSKGIAQELFEIVGEELQGKVSDQTNEG